MPDLFNSLYCNMLDFENYDTQCNLAHYSALVLGTIIEHSALEARSTVDYSFQQLTSSYVVTLESKHFKDKEMQENYQIYFCSCLSSALVTGIELNHEVFDYIYDNITKTFGQRNDVFPEGLLLLSNLCQSKLRNLIIKINRQPTAIPFKAY